MNLWILKEKCEIKLQVGTELVNVLQGNKTIPSEVTFSNRQKITVSLPDKINNLKDNFIKSVFHSLLVESIKITFT